MLRQQRALACLLFLLCKGEGRWGGGGLACSAGGGGGGEAVGVGGGGVDGLACSAVQLSVA